MARDNTEAGQADQQPARRETLVQQAETDDESQLSFEETQAFWLEHPQQFYDEVATVVQKLRERNQQCDKLQAKLQQKSQQVHDLINERDDYAHDLLQALRQREPSQTPETSQKRSVKLPDGLPLNNGIEPTFENWKKTITSKFEVNADHFNGEASKMAFLFRLTTSDAQRHLEPRYQTGRANQFTTAQEMLDYLASIYVDPFKVRNAKYEYRQLRMRKDQLFTDFYTKFLHLAGTAEIPTDDYLDDLIDKITITLKEALLPTQDSYQTYQRLAEHLTGLDQNQRRIKQQKDRIADRITRKSSPDQSARPNKPTDLQPAETAPRTSRPHPTDRHVYFTDERLRLAREGKCFYCKIAGHRAFECPEKKKASVQVIGKEEQSENDEP